jgi:beta-xylosidase
MSQTELPNASTAPQPSFPTRTPAPAESPLPGLYADPNLIQYGDTYYLYPTSDGFEDWAGTSFSVLSSPDLVDWTDHGTILSLGTDVAWASERAWAPAAAQRNGKFYFYFTANGNIGVAAADSPTGPFKDLGEPLVAAGVFAGYTIDPSVFVDRDGSAYLYWGNGTAHGVNLNEDMVSFDAGAVVSWQPEGFREAAWVHRNGDTYYLSWSENDTREDDYRVRYASGPGPLGPWTHHGVILEKDLERGIRATGHHSILNVAGTEDWIIAYHRFAIPGGNGFNRETLFERLVHQPDGSIAKVEFGEEPLHLPIGQRPSP